MSMNTGRLDKSANDVRKQGPGDILMDMKISYPITTVGAGTIPPEAILSGIIDRTGPVGGYADTFPTADQLFAACPDLDRGDSFEFLFINGVAQAMTATAPADGSGVLGTNVNVAASLVRRFMITALSGNSRSVVVSSGTTNANPNVTLTKASDAKLITPGMGVSGTGISAATTVLGVNQSTGVVTLSANATATNSMIGLTFAPRYSVRGLYSATA